MQVDLFAPVPLAPWFRHVAKEDAFQNRQIPPPAVPPLKEKEEELNKPKRPLTAYNLFFQNERVRLLESLPEAPPTNSKGTKKKGKVGFADMARIISARWKQADDAVRAPFCLAANREKIRYHREKDEYKNHLHMLRRREREEEQVISVPVCDNDWSGGNFHPLQEDPFIEDLALQLDKESTEMIIRIFG